MEGWPGAPLGAPGGQERGTALGLDGPRARAVAQNHPRGHQSLGCAQPGVLVVAHGGSQWVVAVPPLPEGQPAHSPHPKKETLLGPETPRLWTACDFTEPCGWHNLLQGTWPRAEAEAAVRIWAEASGYSSVPSTPVQPAGHWEVQGRVTWGWMGGGWEGVCGSSPRSPPFLFFF